MTNAALMKRLDTMRLIAGEGFIHRKVLSDLLDDVWDALLEAPAAGFAEGVEAAARVAESKLAEFDDADNAGNDEAEEAWHGGASSAAYDIASQIRALKAPGQEGEGPAHD